MSHISRRGFVGASLAPVVYGKAADAARVAPSDKVRIGLVGCGGISKADTNAFLAHPESEIVAVFDVDGNYTLTVQASDVSRNQSGDNDYKVRFEVLNKPTITEVLNYPNPFTTSTRFVFTLTGQQPPTYMKI